VALNQHEQQALRPADVATVPGSAEPLVPLRHFARLKLRILGNGFRGRPARTLSFAFGGVFGLYLAGMGFLLFAVTAVGDLQGWLLAASFGGTALVVGSVLLPLVWFGVDDTLDPARFALLPLPRWRLVSGLLVAALLGVPAAAVLIATTGLLIPAGAHGGGPGAVAQLLGIVAGLLLCLALARAVTSAFASVLRSRRVRDLAWVLIACLAALLGPIQIAVITAIGQADWDRIATVARVLSWTPLSAAHTVGVEVAEGRPWAAVAKLAITGAALAAALWWWGRTIESAMAGAASSPTSPTRVSRQGACAQLLPRLLPGLPATAFGALVAREVRYWWRDARRRSSMIMIVVIGLFVPLLVTAGARSVPVDGAGAGVGFDFSLSAAGAASPMTVHLTMVFIAAFVTSTLTNQFGYDGTAYATHLTIGVRGRHELRARAVAYSVFMVPLLLVVGAVMAAAQGSPRMAVATWGVLFAGYGCGLAANMFVSVLAAYPLPETSNPFATGSGQATAKSMLAVVGLLGAGAMSVPVLVAAAMLGDVWPWVALPVGVGYGVAAAAVGTYLTGDVLDRRTPELLATVTPNR
jgi:ABC-2 type transport system permease protein